MKRMTNTYLYPIAVIVLSVFIFLCTSQTVMGQTAERQKQLVNHDSRVIDQIEVEYLAEIRTVLSAHGMSDAGITMTKVTEENGERTYTVILHHKKLNQEDSNGVMARRKAVLAELESRKSGFQFEIL